MYVQRDELQQGPDAIKPRGHASVANIIHTKDLEPVLADAKQAFSPETVLNMKRALEHKLAF